MRTEVRARLVRRGLADYFKDNMFPGGLTYSGHPVACAAALATIAVYEEDGHAPRRAGRKAPVGGRHAIKGLFTFVRWHYFFTNPPLCISEDELREGAAIIDRALASPTGPVQT